MARRVRSRHYGGTVSCSPSVAGKALGALDASLSLGSGDFTVACRGKAVAGAVSALLCGLFNTVYNDGALFLNNAGSFVARVKDATVLVPMSSVAGSFRDFVISANGTSRTFTFYVDGVAVGTSAAWAAGAFPGTMRADVGDGAGGAVPGGADSEFVVDVGHAWTAADALAHNREGTLPRTYTHAWPLDDGAGSTARATRGGLALTLSGGAVFSADSPMIGRGAVRNFVAQGNSVSSAPWTNNQVAFGAYGGAAPAPNVAMVTVSDTNVAQIHAVLQAVPTLPVGIPAVVSAFVANVAGNGWALVSCVTGFVYVNLATGAAGSSQGPYNIEPAIGGWRVSLLQTVTVGFTVYVYVAQSNGVVSYANGGSVSTIAAGGIQAEPAYPGQTTPSPYVATGAAPLSVVGAREWRQNWFAYSDDLTKWTATNGPTVAAGTVSGAANAYLRQLAPAGVGAVAGVQFTYQCEMKADAPCNCTIVAIDATDGTPSTPKVCALTTDWQPFFVTMTTVTPGAGSAGAYIGDGSTGFPVGRTVSVRRSQFAQANGPTAFIATNGAPANSSGAPRSIAA